MKGKETAARVVLCGDNCVNVVLETPAVLTRGANIDLAHSVRRPGGNALVTALALARWGVEVAYVGVVGADDDGKYLLDWMLRAGVEVGGVVERGRTRISYAIVDRNERTILDERRDLDGLNSDDWGTNAAISNAVETANLIMVDRYSAGIHGCVLDVVRKRKLAGAKPVVVYRTGSRGSEGLEIERAFLSEADVCLTKRAYIEGLGLKGSPKEGCRRLSDRFKVPVVVSTLGKEGAAYYDRGVNGGRVVVARPIDKPATTLGGGDWFRAGFIFALLGGMSVADAVRWGNVAAWLHCSRPETEDPVLEFFSVDELKREIGKGV